MVTPSFDDTKDNQATVSPQDMSMEDVLASIRKILDSDNDTGSVVAQTEEERKESLSSATLKKGKGPAQSDELSRESSPPSEGTDTPTENVKTDKDPSAILSLSDKGSDEDEAEDEDVLELTHEIQDDGSEIDLRSQAKGGQSPRGTFPETSTMVDTSDVLTLPTGTGAADISSSISSSKPADYNLDDLYADPLVDSGQEASSDKDLKGKDEKPSSDTHSSDPQDRDVEEFMHTLDTKVSKSAAKESSHEDENTPPSHHKASGTSHGTHTSHTHYRQASGPSLDTQASYQYMHFQDSLLSQESSAASLEILKHLSHTLAHDEEKGTSGPSLEAVVLTALRPILKEWVDKNLPDLISKIVREEIKELVAQAKPK